MTPAARIAAIIELLDIIESAWGSPSRPPSDALIGQYFKGHRYIGSKDRGAIAERVYFLLRHRASVIWWLERLRQPVNARAMVIVSLALGEKMPFTWDTLFTNQRYAAGQLTPPEKKLIEQLQGQTLLHPDMPAYARLNFQPWMERNLTEIFGEDLEAEMAALNREAPVDLRVNTLKATREEAQAALKEEGFNAQPIDIAPNGLRLEKRGAIFTSKIFKQGWFEMQDAGSQLVCSLVDAKPGDKVIDFCAGAGGKTLALAAAMKNRGRVMAWDVSASRLEQITVRLRRAGVDNVQKHVIESENDAFIKRHKNSADRVLVDAPCSGSGTWRRNPDLKWRFGENDLEELCDLQQRILQSAARLVKPGGRLIYATCSLLESENERQIETLVAKKSNLRVVRIEKIWDKIFPEAAIVHGPYLRLTPRKDGADGFFAAVLEHSGEPNAE